VIWLKRVRAGVVIAITWALAWGIAGALLYGAAAFRLKEYQLSRVGGHHPWVTIPALGFLTCGAVGFVAGLLFSLYIGSTTRANRIDRISTLRFALCGLVAGVCIAVPAIFLNSSAALLPAAIGAAIGIVSATGTLLLARRGSLAAPSEAQRRLL
jgi:hypothetical protein